MSYTTRLVITQVKLMILAYLAYALLIGFASFLQGITGFGFAVIAAPIALLFLDAPAIVVSLTIISIVLNSLLVRSIKTPATKRVIRPLIATAILGLPLGLYILNHAPLDSLKIIVGILTIIIALIIFTAKIKLPDTKISAYITGFLSGILTTSIGANGPPLVLYTNGIKQTQEQTRKTLAITLLALALISLPFFLANNNLQPSYIALGLTTIPFVVLGGKMGNRAAQKTPTKAFRYLTLILLLATGLLSIRSGLI